MPRIFRRDEGAATATLMMSMALAMAFVTLLMIRIAHAGDLRTRAQTAADAAALAALTPLRDKAVDLVSMGFMPDSVGYWMVGAPPDLAAVEFAAANGAAVADKVHLTGVRGDTAKVKVATTDCQLKKEWELTPKEKEDLAKRRNLCTDTSGEKGIGRAGTATAIAKMHLPDCVFDPYMTPAGTYAYRIWCAGVLVYPGDHRGQMERLIKLRLVDKEDGAAYVGLPTHDHDGPGDHGGPPPEGIGPGGITPRTAAMRQAVIDNFGAPYDIGCLRVGDPQDHGKGRACDFMTGPYGQMPNSAQLARGDAIAAWAVANADKLGIHYVIWKQHIWNIDRRGEGWRLMENRGSITQNHWDHVHISMY